MRFTARALLLLCFAMATAGCSSTGPKWGANATWTPGWARMQSAAVGAATDPGTWIPAAGAAAIVATDNDERLSDLYWDDKPVFGSEERASDRSDELRADLFRVHILTMLATPSGDTFGEWTANKARGALVQEGALGATRITTNLLKKNTDRKVPSFDPARADRESFPSNHGTEPFAAAALIHRNLQSMALPRWAEYSGTGAAYLAAAGSAWGRVEMGLHYPSDQLAGAAIGNFVALFINDAFMGAGQYSPRLQMQLGRRRVWAQVGWRY